ncbi:MAG: response regulator [Ignavibacteriae bacterium]|nr:response regulator [Ignavibacteria bacterium]MBI3365865.1 response regulator [Ignavibacteriota bacterium]
MGHNLKMLCVDDHPDLRKSLQEQFAAEDFDVDTAEDGLAALEKIKNTHYDIILLDIGMPRMDGMKVLKEMKKLNKYTNVIMLTATDDVPTAIECVKLGAKDYISKPYDPEELLHVVIKVLGA